VKNQKREICRADLLRGVLTTENNKMLSYRIETALQGSL